MVTNRKEAQIGEPITVSVLAENIGDENGEFSLELFINNQKRETKSIMLGADKTTSVQFEIVENNEGTYVVTLGTLTTSYKITSEAQTVKPAEFQVTDLMVNPSSVLTGEAVKISVIVTNIGEENGNYIVNLEIDGANKDTREISLAGQASEVVEFEVTETIPGTHTVGVANQIGSFIVEDLAPASPNIGIAWVSRKPI